MCGNGCAIADVRGNGNGTVTISGKKGTTEFYQAAMWKDDAGNVLSKYLVKVKITVAAAFSHTAVVTPVMDGLNAADTTRFTLALEEPDALLTAIPAKGKITLVPKDGAALVNEWGLCRRLLGAGSGGLYAAILLSGLWPGAERRFT